MKIGIDYIATIGKGGNSTYSKNLIDSMVKLDRKNQYYFYGYVHDFFRGRFEFKKSQNVHWRPVFFSSLGLPVPQTIVRACSAVSLRFWAKIDRLDVFHFTNPLYYVKGLKKNVVTIHDLSSFHNLEWSKGSSRLLFSKIIKDIVTSSSVIAVSEYTKQDIIKTFGVNPDKITVVHEAADPKKYYPDYNPEYLRDKFNLESYFLYVGQLQPRKNIINILLAYSRLSSDLKEKYPLVLVGNMRDENYSRLIHKTISEHKLESHVRILGPLDDDSVRKLYSGARVLVFPSLFEGFGLPVLESLQCGTPVITSNTSSLPEVAGDAGVLVNPENGDEIYQALEKVLADEDFYRNLKGRSLTQAGKFSWEKATRETIAIYEKIFSGLKIV